MQGTFEVMRGCCEGDADALRSEHFPSATLVGKTGGMGVRMHVMI